MSIPSYYRTKERVQMALKVHISTLSFYQLSSVSSSSFTGFTPNMFGTCFLKFSYRISIIIRHSRSVTLVVSLVTTRTPPNTIFLTISPLFTFWNFMMYCEPTFRITPPTHWADIILCYFDVVLPVVFINLWCPPSMFGHVTPLLV